MEEQYHSIFQYPDISLLWLLLNQIQHCTCMLQCRQLSNRSYEPFREEDPLEDHKHLY